MHDLLRRLDLNLLLIFDALFRHRSVVAAADELSMSPSACSHALSRLRVAFSDELFVRYGSAMQPTIKAEQMADGIADALRILSNRLPNSGVFVPATSKQTFVFAATDYTAFALLPKLIPCIAQQAPNVCIKVVYSTRRDSIDELAAGRIHFALGFSDESGSMGDGDGLETLDFFSDEYVIAARQDHPRIEHELNLEQYLAERHIVVLPWSDEVSLIDVMLAKQGLKREVSVQLPSVMAAPFIVANSDLLITVPLRAAQQLIDAAPLKVFSAPFHAPRFTLRALYHSRYGSMPGHRWMRDQMLLALGNNDS